MDCIKSSEKNCWMELWKDTPSKGERRAEPCSEKECVLREEQGGWRHQVGEVELVGGVEEEAGPCRPLLELAFYSKNKGIALN